VSGIITGQSHIYDSHFELNNLKAKALSCKKQKGKFELFSAL
jgi:hypothetical protein